MTSRKYWIAVLAAGVLSFSAMGSARGRAIAGTGPTAQTTAEPAGGFGTGITLQAELSKGLDAKKAKSGDPVEAKLTQDVKANGKVLLRRGAKLIGHVTDSQAKTKEAESRLGFVFDKALPKGGEEIAFNGVVEAVAAPLEGGSEVAGDPGSLSSAPAMGGAPFGAGHSMGGPSASSAPAVGSAVTPVGAAGPARNTGVAANGALTPASRGAFGIDGVSLHEATIKGAQGTLLISPSHNVKLDGGTQLVVQVVAPAAAK
ncbi:MAG TPA: hypothetical protein VKH81_20270 [Candidatus Angelobacter sp.]|nr:hypothetical protein [Candidatus Angelobacter sp.]